jgi:hypothetical protein
VKEKQAVFCASLPKIAQKANSGIYIYALYRIYLLPDYLILKAAHTHS